MEATLTHVRVKQPAVSFFLFNVHYSTAWINSLRKTDSLCSIYCHPDPKLKKQLRCEEPSCSKVDWQHQTTYLVFILGLGSPIRVSATWFSWTAFTLIECFPICSSRGQSCGYTLDACIIALLAESLRHQPFSFPLFALKAACPQRMTRDWRHLGQQVKKPINQVVHWRGGEWKLLSQLSLSRLVNPTIEPKLKRMKWKKCHCAFFDDWRFQFKKWMC